jgi:8-oxo-dGTP diphosphatase
MSGSQQTLPRLAASACIWRDGRVLIAQRAKPPVGLWALPGGHVEPGETAHQAAIRELHEETGMTAGLDTLVGLFDLIRRDEAGLVISHYAIACYAGLAGEGEASPASDTAAVAWVRPEDLGRYQLALQVRKAILKARELLQV